MVSEMVDYLATATAVWHAGGRGAGTPVAGLRVMFDDAYSAQLDGMVNDSDPTCTVKASQFPGVRRGDELDITPDETGVVQVFSVIKAMPDGVGGVVLDLREVGP
jgi:hypothetical protein